MITVYTSPTCGKCKVLKAKLAQKEIPYQESQDVAKMESLGIQSLPAMELDSGKLLTFGEALQYISER